MRWVVFTLAAMLGRGITASSDVATLRDAAQARGIFFGAALNVAHIRGTDSNSSTYRAVAAQQYSLVTAENACKWGGTEQRQGVFDFDACDAIANFTTQTMNGTFRGHNLCWGNYNPAWLPKLDAGAKKAALQAHIAAMVTHYGETAYAWDVVNEAITDNSMAADPLKSTDWYPSVPDYIDVAFTAARAAAGPKVKLFYNDYNIASSSGFSAKKSQRVYDLVQGMQARGVPIDGVGLQLHIQSDYADFAGVQANMERLGALGLEVHITELDVSLAKDEKWDAAAEAKQATVYASMLEACLAVPACKNFETWGFTDGSTWKGFANHPLPFDEKYVPKAAVDAMLAVLTKAPTPAPPPTPSPPAREYEKLSRTCQNATAVSPLLSVASVTACEAACDAHSGCDAVDTDGSSCYLKSTCHGTPDASCSGWCGYRLKSAARAAPWLNTTAFGCNTAGTSCTADGDCCASECRLMATGCVDKECTVVRGNGLCQR